MELLKGHSEYVIPEKSVENPFNAYVPQQVAVWRVMFFECFERG